MDNDMDGCECFWSEQLAMRRLLSLLRQSQSLCTDTICFDSSSSTPQNTTTDAPNDFMLLSMLAGLLMLLYLFKPKSMRNTGNTIKNEPFNDSEGPNNGSPPPAVN